MHVSLFNITLLLPQTYLGFVFNAVSSHLSINIKADTEANIGQ